MLTSIVNPGCANVSTSRANAVGVGLNPPSPLRAVGTTSTPTGEFGQVGVSACQIPRHSLSIVFGAGCRRVDFNVVYSPGVQIAELPTRPAGLAQRSHLLSLLQDIETAMDSNVTQPVALENGERVGYVVRSSVR